MRGLRSQWRWDTREGATPRRRATAICMAARGAALENSGRLIPSRKQPSQVEPNRLHHAVRAATRKKADFHMSAWHCGAADVDLFTAASVWFFDRATTASFNDPQPDARAGGRPPTMIAAHKQ